MTPLTSNEIKQMEKACQLAARTLTYVGQFVKPGITTNEIDKIVYDYTLSNDAIPAPLNYNGFPKSVCTSVNDCICHGVPDDQVLKDGDMLNIDVTSVKQGFFGDTSAMFFVGEVSDKAKMISECAKQAMERGIAALKPFATTGDVGFAINKYITKRGYFPVKEIGGHGIGKVFHGEPFMPSYGKKGRGDRLKPWKCITIEPMVNETDAEMITYDIKDCSVSYYKTGDGTLSAQYEHTVLITDTGYEILTLD